MKMAIDKEQNSKVLSSKALDNDQELDMVTGGKAVAHNSSTFGGWGEEKKTLTKESKDLLNDLIESQNKR